jgi:hypothetical protein
VHIHRTNISGKPPRVCIITHVPPGRRASPLLGLMFGCMGSLSRVLPAWSSRSAIPRERSDGWAAKEDLPGLHLDGYRTARPPVSSPQLLLLQVCGRFTYQCAGRMALYPHACMSVKKSRDESLIPCHDVRCYHSPPHRVSVVIKSR